MVFVCLFWMRKVKLVYILLPSRLFAFVVFINVRKSMCLENKRWQLNFSERMNGRKLALFVTLGAL